MGGDGGAAIVHGEGAEGEGENEEEERGVQVHPWAAALVRVPYGTDAVLVGMGVGALLDREAFCQGVEVERTDDVWDPFHPPSVGQVPQTSWDHHRRHGPLHPFERGRSPAVGALARVGAAAAGKKGQRPDEKVAATSLSEAEGPARRIEEAY